LRPRKPIEQPSDRSFTDRLSHFRISPTLSSALTLALQESPDPDSALALLDRFLSESSPETVGLLEKHPQLAHYLLIIFGQSRFLSETLIRNTDLLQTFLQDKNLDQSFSREEFQENLARFRSRSFETDPALLLTRFKRREYVRILLRDALRIAPLAETTAEISALSDTLIEEALREARSALERRYGTPQHVNSEGRLEPAPFCVLSLGKLGGNELNYASDVDLMYLFGDGDDPPDALISSREYFIRLAQQVTNILSRMTPDGVVFRIDLRLRPQGNEGELVITLTQALHYYANLAHDWELQALIKVRHSAGDANLARQFIRGVQPRVYTKELNFAAIKTALVAREKMQKGRSRNQHSFRGIDVKIDRGGIRDIEFLVQCLQRVYGGAEPWLRSGGTLFSLQKLHDNRHISSREFRELTAAYEFLRDLEHRLQLRDGQQTHRLPSSDAELAFLQRAIDPNSNDVPHPQSFLNLVQQLMASVAEIYPRIIYQQQDRAKYEGAGRHFQLHAGPESSLADQSNRQILERLSRDAPQLHQLASRDDLTISARKNLFRFLTASLTSSERYAAVLRHIDMIPRALVLLETSEYLADILVRHPEEVGTLGDLGEIRSRVGTGYLFESSLLQVRATDPVFSYVADSHVVYSEKLSLLRRHFRHRVFSAGAKDVIERRAVYESFADTTAAAEDAIAAAFQIAGAPDGLAILALGRLGSGEFDLLSDADLLFVCEDGAQREALTKPVAQIVQVLAVYTSEGMIFPVDTRLRPHGTEGELLVTPSQLSAYFEQEAHAWEALSYTKLRILAGNRTLSNRVMLAANALFSRFSRDAGFSQAVRDMRSKLEGAEVTESFKTSPGAIYDIDFLCSFLLVKHSIADKGGTLRDRLWRCVSAGLIEKPQAAALDHAAELLRTVDHVVRLVAGRAERWLPANEHARGVAARLTAQILQREFPDGLEAELEKIGAIVRNIYDRQINPLQ